MNSSSGRLSAGNFAHNVRGRIVFDSLICAHLRNYWPRRPSCQRPKDVLDPARRHYPAFSLAGDLCAGVGRVVAVENRWGYELGALPRAIISILGPDRRWHRPLVVFALLDRSICGCGIWRQPCNAIHTCSVVLGPFTAQPELYVHRFRLRHAIVFWR